MLNERIEILVQIETIQDKINDLLKIIRKNDLRRNNFKEVMNKLKEGGVQKDMEFLYYYEDNLFLKLSRSVAVRNIEKEIHDLNNIISINKNKLKDEVKALKKIIEIKNSLVTLNDLDEETKDLLQDEMFDL